MRARARRAVGLAGQQDQIEPVESAEAAVERCETIAPPARANAARQASVRKPAENPPDGRRPRGARRCPGATGRRRRAVPGPRVGRTGRPAAAAPPRRRRGPAPRLRGPSGRPVRIELVRGAGRRGPLPHSAARAARPRRGPAPHRHEALLRAARAAPDREDLGAARAARPAQRAGGAPLRVHERRARADGAGRRGRRDADGAGRALRGGAHRSRRRLSGPELGADAGARGSARGPAPDAEAVVPERSQAARAPDRRDRHAGGRHADLGAAPAARGVRRPSRGVPAERGPVRRPRRARLPHPLGLRRRGRHRRQRLQRQGEVAESGRLRRGRHARPARPAHRGDRAGVHGGRAHRDVGPVPGPAVAGQRAGLPGVLRERGRPGPLARHRRGGGHGRPGGARPGAPDALAQARRPAPGRAGAAGDRAGADRRRGRRGQGERRRCGVRPRPRPAGAQRPPPDRQPDLTGR